MTLRDFRKAFDNLFNCNKDKLAFFIEKEGVSLKKRTPVNFAENKDVTLSSLGITGENVSLCVGESETDVNFEETEQVGSYPPVDHQPSYNINDSGDYESNNYQGGANLLDQGFYGSGRDEDADLAWALAQSLKVSFFLLISD